MPSGTSPDPQPGEFWATAKGRTVEIVARSVVRHSADWPYEVIDTEVDTVAYTFLGGSMIHMRAVSALTDWRKVNFE